MIAKILASKIFHSPDNAISTKPGLCPTVKSPAKSSCNRCKDFCPCNSIKIGVKIEVKENCTDCGLCITACPNGVFDSTKETDTDIIERALQYLTTEKTTTSGFLCSMVKNEKNAVRLECLGRLNENILLTLLSKGKEVFRFKRGECEGCALKAGKQLFDETLILTRGIVQALGYNEMVFQEVEESGVRGKNIGINNYYDEHVSRRDFFKKLTARALFEISDVFDKAYNSTVTPKVEVTNFKREKLIHILKTFNSVKNEIENEQKTCFPFARLQINNNCIGCDVCQYLCPTSAIKKREDDSLVSLSFLYQQCTNCKICEIACLTKAIELEEVFDYEELVKQEEKEVIRLKKCICKCCRQVFHAKEGELCPFCSNGYDKYGNSL